jgi:hypothetical protein
MSDMNDWNTWDKSVIAEFRASEGRVGGNLEGMPMVLVHHFGRKSGQEYVNPLASAKLLIVKPDVPVLRYVDCCCCSAQVRSRVLSKPGPYSRQARGLVGHGSKSVS